MCGIDRAILFGDILEKSCKQRVEPLFSLNCRVPGMAIVTAIGRDHASSRPARRPWYPFLSQELSFSAISGFYC